MARVLVIADNQMPFEHRDYLWFLKSVKLKYKTNLVVHIGDELDHHCLSDWDHDPDGFSAGHELKEAKIHLKPYMQAFPEMMICTSNHTVRIYAKAKKAGIPRAYLKDYKDFLDAPSGWKWADSWEIDGVKYLHGVQYSGIQGALNACRDALKPCVIGHLHAEAGLSFWSNGREVLWGLNVGSGIDADAYAFEYGKVMRKKPILSCGVVINGRPYLEFMGLDKNKRWDGKL